jgi:lysophospholipase L1-like esterase
VQCKLGQSEPRRWTVTPGPGDVGDHPWSIRANDARGRALGMGKCVLHVLPADAGAGKQLRLLIVGDSLTAATAYPNEIARLLAEPGNPAWTMLGTYRPSTAGKGVAHEGYGGWTWQRFLSHYEPKPDPAAKKRSSPFVFVGSDGKPAIDLPRYFRESCGGQQPDVVTFLLGINDCFAANPEDPAAIDKVIDGMFGQADALLAAMRQAAPNADLGVCLTTPPNARESGFEANYKGRYHRWGWKRIQHQLVQRQLEHFAGKQGQRVFLVPTELNLDPVDGYPDNNGVHPNTAGYQQIGQSIYAWIKWRLQTRGNP